MRTVFDKTLVRAQHFRSFRVQTTREIGWEASERQDQAIVNQQRFSDWHRVEQVLHGFRQHIADLLAAGWTEA
jgi:hypothetical protein